MKINSKFNLFFLALFLFTTVTVLSQEKFGGLALYTVRTDMDKVAKETIKSNADAKSRFN